MEGIEPRVCVGDLGNKLNADLPLLGIAEVVAYTSGLVSIMLYPDLEIIRGPCRRRYKTGSKVRVFVNTDGRLVLQKIVAKRQCRHSLMLRPRRLSLDASAAALHRSRDATSRIENAVINRLKRTNPPAAGIIRFFRLKDACAELGFDIHAYEKLKMSVAG